MIIGNAGDTAKVNVYKDIKTDDKDGDCVVLNSELAGVKLAISVTVKTSYSIVPIWLEAGTITAGENAVSLNRTRLQKYLYLNAGDKLKSTTQFGVSFYGNGHEFGYDGVDRGWNTAQKGKNGYDSDGNFISFKEGYYRVNFAATYSDEKVIEIADGFKITNNSDVEYLTKNVVYGDPVLKGLQVSWLEQGSISNGANAPSTERGRLKEYIYLNAGDVIENTNASFKFGIASFGIDISLKFEGIDYGWNTAPKIFTQDNNGGFYKNNKLENFEANLQNVFVAHKTGYFRINFAKISNAAIDNEQLLEFATAIKIYSSNGYEYESKEINDSMFAHATGREDNSKLMEIKGGAISQDGVIVDDDIWMFDGSSKTWDTKNLYQVDILTGELKNTYTHNLGHINGADYRVDGDDGYLLSFNGNAQGTQVFIYKNPKKDLEETRKLSNENIDVFFDLSKVNIGKTGNWIKYGAESDQKVLKYNASAHNGMSYFNTTEKYDGTDYNKYAIYPDGSACFGETREFMYYVGTTDMSDKGKNAILKIQLGMGLNDLRDADAKDDKQGHISGGEFKPLTKDGDYNGTFKIVAAYHSEEKIGQAQGCTYYNGEIFVGTNYSSMNSVQLQLIDNKSDMLNGTIKNKHTYLYPGIKNEAELTVIKDGKLYIGCIGNKYLGIFDISEYN